MFPSQFCQDSILDFRDRGQSLLHLTEDQACVTEREKMRSWRKINPISHSTRREKIWLDHFLEFGY
jgi:hypothetical protein